MSTGKKILKAVPYLLVLIALIFGGVVWYHNTKEGNLVIKEAQERAAQAESQAQAEAHAKAEAEAALARAEAEANAALAAKAKAEETEQQADARHRERVDGLKKANEELARLKNDTDAKLAQAEADAKKKLETPPPAEEDSPKQKFGMSLEVEEQDGDWIVTSTEEVPRDPTLGVRMWVCKGPTGKPIVAEPGTPADYIERYVKFKVERPAGTVFKAHPRPSRRGSTVWVLVKE